MKQQRNTIQRQLVLEAVCALHHPDAETVYAYLSQRYPRIGKATVYRNLNLLAQRGDIAKIETADGADKFDRDLHPHYHLRCRACGRVFDAPMPVLDGLEGRLGDTDGFLVERHTIEFIGLCHDCKKNITDGGSV